MSRGIAIFLVLVMLFRGFGSLIEGLAMVPYLFDHYQIHLYHSHIYHHKELSFPEFFLQHYGGLKHHNDVGGKHSDLPFSHSDKISVYFDLVLTKSGSIFSPRWAWEDGVKEGFSWNSLYSHLYLHDIFHPPLA